MFAASKSGSVDAKDPQFNYVTMLLHGNGTNGAQNNTFVDSSANNFTITRNGNTTQGTFTPYGSNWSNNFVQSATSYLSISNNAAFQFGTGNFTIEGWFYASSLLQSGNYDALFSIGSYTDGVLFRYQASGTSGNDNFWIAGTSYNWQPYTYITVGVWNHIAVVRNGSSVNVYVNGTSVLSVTNSSTVSPAGSILVGGQTHNPTQGPWNGYISNFRVVKGTAVYTTAFTPSTTPLTAISGTSLLTCQSNRFVDNSSNAFTVTTNGSPSVQRFSPFSPTTAYSTSVIGGSGYFDGSGDYLDAGTNTAFAVGTGDFTIELWVYPTAFSGIYTGYFTTRTGGQGFDIQILNATSTLMLGNSTGPVISANNVLSLNTWQHICAVRSGSTNSLYVNGTRVATGTDSTNFTDNGAKVGSSGPSGGNNGVGYISNVRLVKGTAVYSPSSSTLTVPTAPLSAVSGTSLLCSMTNAGILDNAMMNDLETVGNAQISTSVKKYGTGSIYLDGTGDAVLALSNPQGDFGSGNFTLEGWFYQTATTNQGYFSKRANTSSFSPFLVQYDSNQLSAYLSTSGSSWAVAINASTNPSTNTWNHVAFVRNGSTATLYLNGTSVGSASISGSLMTNSTPVVIGAQASDASNVFNGYIDDLRITKGYARYTANFSVPTAAFPDKG